MADAKGLLARALAGLKYTASGIVPGEWFGPGIPMAPQAPADVAGRRLDFPVAINLNYQPRSTEAVNFQRLKMLAQNCNPLRMVMQRQIDLAKELRWRIKPKVDAPKGTKEDPAIAELTNFFNTPDGRNDWPQWLNGMLEQLFVYDAVSIYKRKNQGGGIFGFELIDGATITPILDATGRIPFAPDAGYEQILKGLPAVQYTTDELLYYPEHYRVDQIYGYSRVEQMVTIADMSIARMESQRGYFTNGNIGDGYFTAPPEVQPEMIGALKEMWNNQMTAGLVARRQVPFLPAKTEWHPTKVDLLEDAFDEWLIRLVCFPFGVEPTPFMKQTGMSKGAGKGDQKTAAEGGLAPVMEYIRNLCNRLIGGWLGRPDLEFAWVDNREFDPKINAEIQDMKLRNGTATINQINDENGADHVDGGDAVLLFTGSAWTKLDDIITPPPPPAPPLAPVGLPLTAGAGEPEIVVPVDEKKKELAKAAANKKVTALQKTIADYLTSKAAEIAPILADTLADFGKADETNGPDYDKSINTSFGKINWVWSDLPEIVAPDLADIAIAAGTVEVEALDLFTPDILAAVTKTATAFAEARAAEMVGMRWVEGELIENPDALWSISSATRDMLRTLLRDAMERGADNYELTKEIKEATAFSDERSSTIARTESGIADVQGQISGWRASGVVEGKRFDAAPDCCDVCQTYDGLIVGLDEEFPEGDAPIHPNCLTGDTLVLADNITAVTERPFEGNVVVVRTASNKRLTCTPNHPVLTPSGWVAAGLLDIGDDVISSCVGDFVAGSHVSDNAEDMPARIENIAKAFGRSLEVTTRKVPVAAPHFHGDGEGSEVAIIRTNRLLRDSVDSALCKHCGESIFANRTDASLEHAGTGGGYQGLGGDLASTPGGMSGFNLGRSRVGGHGRPFEGLAFAGGRWFGDLRRSARRARSRTFR
jgi:hypothetical protein